MVCLRQDPERCEDVGARGTGVAKAHIGCVVARDLQRNRASRVAVCLSVSVSLSLSDYLFIYLSIYLSEEIYYKKMAHMIM